MQECEWGVGKCEGKKMMGAGLERRGELWGSLVI